MLAALGRRTGDGWGESAGEFSLSRGSGSGGEAAAVDAALCDACFLAAARVQQRCDCFIYVRCIACVV